MAKTPSTGARSAIVIAAIAFVLTGCATNRAMMPTPVLYTGENARALFTELSIDSRRSPLDLLFITDRAPAEQGDDLPYTARRSRSMAFGSTMIEFGSARMQTRHEPDPDRIPIESRRFADDSGGAAP